jgi:hypothetical protein
MRSLLLLSLYLSLAPAAARAFDLTGTWSGRYTCKGTDGSKFGYSVPGTLPFSGGNDVYNGVAITDARNCSP